MAVTNILFPPTIVIAAIKYGRDIKEMAKQNLSEILKKNIKLCELFIDFDNPCLGASPNGLLDENDLVEIKSSFNRKFNSRGSYSYVALPERYFR